MNPWGITFLHLREIDQHSGWFHSTSLVQGSCQTEEEVSPNSLRTQSQPQPPPVVPGCHHVFRLLEKVMLFEDWSISCTGPFLLLLSGRSQGAEVLAWCRPSI